MGNVEIPRWLKDLPLAPEFRPTDTEFADPVAYISKIEKEASAFGICKIIPPLPKPSKRYVISNLNKSLSKCPELDVGVGLSSPCSSLKTDSGDSANHEEVRAVFTTRLQELGQGMKRTKGMIRENPQLGVHKQVWQSGEIYTLEQFETKSKAFARSMLDLIKEINPLVIEALFWGAASEKPISVEYANDVPGSAFGEPESQFRYFHRRRRKRASYRSYRRSTESSDCKKVELDNVKNSSNEEVKGTAIKNDSCISSETMPTSSITLSTSYLKETLRSSKQRSLNASNDMEGTAGWKLSNSPWNLQVIARSPGSLTRFMPDDIPGVTSPMIYIGMLFSWFAWHVEDHELHSMNFLHTGSPKTWYSVPGDYAFAFEEVIRTEAYGGSIDRLAALTLLGEKTTLMSPEVVVSSGIPCCRLVQNPGEFVVTFPRAYHVGFSHGFNCGEAANFGTPQWLKVAKEAAVRRAAMNYLPMLSHQQLLYLLTMSFVSRVPRSLLPGARSSRLRDRLKEERELSVKKAFIEDILKENSILSVLLGKESACNVVIWNPDLLPCASKESQLLNTIASTTEENVFHTCSEDNSNTTENDLFKEMSLYMETLNDLYVDDADLSCDFQVDSGTLPCVACGILGFPFMSVVKPSETASVEVLQMDHSLIQEESKAEKFEHCHSSAVPDGFIRGSIADLALPSGWKNCSKILRPRIFCLEHGLQIEELLRSKGGANMSIICHSDYQKMKAHAVAIAEEIDIPFHYKEVPLENASQEDLNLIYLAIDNEDHEECGEDWTSKMGINLRYCVKVRKNSPSNKAQHAFALGGLFSDGSTSDFLNIKWQSKRSRSQMTLNKRAQYKPCDAVEAKKNVLGRKSDNVVIERKEKLIQYTRKKYKVKIDCSTTRGEGFSREYMEEEVSVASCEALMKHTGKTSKIDTCNVGIGGSDSAGICFSPIGMSGVLHDVQVLEATGDMSLNSGSLDITSSLIPPTTGVEHVVRLVDNQTLEKTNRKENVWDLAVGCKFKIQQEEKVTGGTGVDGDSNATGCSRPCMTEANERPEMQGGYKMTQNISLVNETCNMVSEGQHKVLAGRDVLLNEVGDLAKPISLNVSHPPTGQMEDIVAEKFCMNNEVYVCLTTDNEVEQELQTRKKRNNSECISYNDTLMNQLAASEKSTKCLQDTFAAEDELQHEDEITGESNGEEIVLKNVRMINHPNNISVDEHSEISREPCAAANLCYDGTLGNGVLQAIQTPNERKEEHASCSARQMEIDQTTTLVEGFPEVLEGISSEEDLCTGTTLDSQLLLKIPATNRSNVEKLASYSSSQIQDPPVHVTVEGYFEVPGGKCAAKDLYIGMKNLDVKVQDIHSDDGLSTNDEAHEICQTTSATNEKENLFKKWSGTEEESCTAENTLKGQEVCSSHKLESIESAVVDLRTTAGKGKKRKNELEQLTDNKLNSYAFIRSPCEGLRPRAGKDATYRSAVDVEKIIQENPVTKKTRKHSDGLVLCTKKKEAAKRSHKCDLEGCPMSFETKAELQLHKRNRCPYEGCKKRFNSHKYAIIHQRVHEDDRPLKCPWKGCSMSFKWAWARTEHIRVHTGEKPYKCKVEGCGLSFRFVSDFSRHRRKTGHYVNTPA